MIQGSHIFSGTQSKRIIDGTAQEVVMDPSLTVGTRKYLTTLDLAFLRDLGYSTIIPEFGIAGDYNRNGVVDSADYVVWRETDGTQPGYTTWRARFGQSTGSGVGSSANATVPEPAAAVMLIAGILALLSHRDATIR